MTHPEKLADDPFVFLGLLLFMPAAYLWQWAGSEAKALDEMDALPLGRVRSAAMGRCMVYGQVEALGDLVLAPVSGESVVWYRWEKSDIEEWDLDQAEPEERAGASSQEPFRLVDGDASIVIVPKNARAFRTEFVGRWEDAVLEPKTEKGKALLGKHPAREWSIRPGDILVAVGWLQPGQGLDSPPRLVDAAPETPLLFAVGWDRVQAWNDKRRVRWARAAAIVLFCAAFYLIF